MVVLLVLSSQLISTFASEAARTGALAKRQLPPNSRCDTSRHQVWLGRYCDHNEPDHDRWHDVCHEPNSRTRHIDSSWYGILDEDREHYRDLLAAAPEMDSDEEMPILRGFQEAMRFRPPGVAPWDDPDADLGSIHLDAAESLTMLSVEVNHSTDEAEPSEEEELRRDRLEQRQRIRQAMSVWGVNRNYRAACPEGYFCVPATDDDLDAHILCRRRKGKRKRKDVDWLEANPDFSRHAWKTYRISKANPTSPRKDGDTTRRYYFDVGTQLSGNP